MKAIVQSIKTIFHFRSSCYLCQQKFRDQKFRKKTLCKACQNFLSHTEFFCTICGNALPQKNICGQCLISPPLYQQTIPCFWYEEPIQTLIHDYKFNQKLSLTPILGNLMAEKIQTHYQNTAYPNCIIPMPIHPKRLRERGYHQVYELAKILSHQLSIPVKLNTCRRIKHSQPQSDLPFKERKENIKNVFQAKKILYQHIAILDDVITTGETVSELCKTLKKENSHLMIDVWCLARTKFT